MRLNSVLVIFLFVISSLIQGCVDENGGEGEGTVTRSIIGEWQYIYPATQCSEVNTFNEDGTFYGTALDEIYSGNYVFDSTVSEGSRHLIKFTITEDNGLPDCKGRSSISTGLEITLYAEFSSIDTLAYYENNVGGNPIIEFNRVVK